MTSKKPKGRTPSLISSSNGKPKRITIERKTKCCRCSCSIVVGQDCFGIPKSGSGFSTTKKYCKDCFQKVLEQTHKDLEDVKNLLVAP